MSIGPSLGVFYGMRLIGQPELAALIAATVVAGAQVLVKVIRSRTFDLLSGFLLANFGLSLIVALVTGDPRVAQVSNTIPGVVLALFFCGSAVVGRPLTESLVERLRPGRIAQLSAEQAWSPRSQRAYHRMHLHLSFWCGIVNLLVAGLAVAVIYNFSADIAQAVNQVVSLVSTCALIIGIVVVIRRYLHRLGLSARLADGAGSAEDAPNKIEP